MEYIRTLFDLYRGCWNCKWGIVDGTIFDTKLAFGKNSESIGEKGRQRFYILYKKFKDRLFSLRKKGEN